MRRLLAILFVCFVAIATPALAFWAQFMAAAPPSAVPAVASNSFTITQPLANGEAVGTATATNSPTSWSITACSPSCSTYFAISNAGAITVTSAGASGLTAQSYTLGLQATNGAGSGSNNNTVTVNGGAYTGFADQYPSAGTYWASSVYKVSSSYAGNWATVQRTSDSTSQAIGFTSGLASASSLTSFCANTVCNVTTLYDQSGNGNNATCSNVRAFVAADGRVAISPQAGGNCTIPYASTLAAAKVEMFAVASLMFADSRPYQAGVPTYVTTGNVTTTGDTSTVTGASISSGTVTINFSSWGYTIPVGTGIAVSGVTSSGASGGGSYNQSYTVVTSSATSITAVYTGSGSPGTYTSGGTISFGFNLKSVANLTGVSPNNNQPQQQGIAGVQDSAGCLPGSGGNPGASEFTLIGTNIVHLSIQPGYFGPSCSSTGDTLTFTNAVLGGPLIAQGPNAAMGSAYWGVGFGVLSLDSNETDSVIVRNATDTNASSNIGQAIRQTLGVWDFDTYTGTIYYDGAQVSAGVGSSANVTYSTNVGITLFQAPNGTDQLQNAVVEQIILIANPSAYARTTVSAWLQTQYSLTAPATTYTTSDGFIMKSELLTSYPSYSNAFGDNNVTDANGIVWYPQNGGYFGPSGNGPSLSYATNINNGATMWRSVVQQGDSEVNVTGAERAEASSGSTIVPGQNASFFGQFTWETYVDQTGGWCLQDQIHFNNQDGNNTPDIFAISCTGNQIQLTYGSPGGSQTSCGSPITLTQGVTYAIEGELVWQNPSDSINVWLGVNGTSLTLTCSASGSLFPNDTGAYMKAGAYRGYPWSNSGTLALREINMRFSNTAGAYAAYRTTQPPLPTHAANDNGSGSDAVAFKEINAMFADAANDNRDPFAEAAYRMRQPALPAHR